MIEVTLSAMRSCIFLFAFAAACSLANAAPRYALAVHGGAGSSPKIFTTEQNTARHNAIKAALATGEAVLSRGGSAIDAVEAAIRIMEDEPLFNAGRGSVLNRRGRVEMDASIMSGETKACGAVAGVTVAKNPISVARGVMEKTRHVLLSGPGADQFTAEMDAKRASRDYFITASQKARWQKAIEAEKKKDKEKEDKAAHSGPANLSDWIGTVGCVAMDSKGNLAAGTSTGGLIMKKFGRVGDSPIIGAGTYADNLTCAVSCTGVGEEFIRNAIAYDIHATIHYGGATLKAAVTKQLTEVLKPGFGGIIAINPDGEIEMQFNTGGMACGAADSEGRFEVRWPGGEKAE